MTEASLVSVAGWSLALGAASKEGAGNGEFYAVYRGEDFAAPHRGLLALVARGDESGRAAVEAAEVSARLFAEGFFGVLATLGPALAAARALSSANSWVYRQSRDDPQRLGMAASLLALACPASKRLMIVHLGENRAYLKREHQLLPLTSEHLRPLPSGGAVLTRALGLEREAQADVTEIDARSADRIVLVGAALVRAIPADRLGALLSRDVPAETLAQEIAAAAPGGATVLIVDVLTAPAAQFDDLAADYAALPIRPPPQEGDMWDGFLVGRTIYRGRYTLLKRARDTIENREVVLKLPLPAMAQDPVFQAGFLREAWIGAQLRSKWTIDYLDLPQERRSCLYLVMPYYRGTTLEERLKNPPPVSLAEGFGIAVSLCEAIEDLASRQVIHRDIKPENIFLLASGKIKLLDLGLASLPSLDDSERDNLGGTTRYMAPELFRGTAASPRSEVFSLGVTLYRMFSGGDFPFGRKEAYPLARARPDLPPWLGRTIRQAIETDPARRFADTAAFRRALEYGLAHEDWRGPPRWKRDPATLWRLIAAGLALCCLALALWRR